MRMTFDVTIAPGFTPQDMVTKVVAAALKAPGVAAIRVVPVSETLAGKPGADAAVALQHDILTGKPIPPPTPRTVNVPAAPSGSRAPVGILTLSLANLSPEDRETLRAEWEKSSGSMTILEPGEDVTVHDEAEPPPGLPTGMPAHEVIDSAAGRDVTVHADGTATVEPNA